MNYCKCGNQIPRKVTINGKARNLLNRTKCLVCLPFGERVYTKLTPEEVKSKSAAKHKKWREKQKKEFGLDSLKSVRKNRKTEIIKAIGGGCQLCGYNKVLRNLVFHHVRDKVFTLDERRFQYSMEKLVKEIVKCTLVCHNCHGEIHAGVIEPILVQKANDHLVSVILNFTPEKMKNQCNRCGNPCNRSFCPSCNPMRKAEWPNDQDFILEVQRSSGASVARRLGVSDTVVLKRYNRLKQILTGAG